MKKISVALLLSTLLACYLHAQDTTLMITKTRYLNLDFAVGHLHTGLSDINSFLTSYGYKLVSEDIVTLSFSPSIFINRFVFRGEYTWQFPTVRTQGNNTSAVFTGRHVSMGVGYVMIQKPGFRLYPYVSINSFTSQLIVKESSYTSTLDGLVSNQQRGFSLRYSNTSLDVGLQLDKLISLKNKKWDCPQNAKFMTIGTRVGYHIGPGALGGRFNGRQIEGSPAYAPSGPYAKLVMGFSTKVRDLKWRK
jgi:hypothetical protein